MPQVALHPHNAAERGRRGVRERGDQEARARPARSQPELEVTQILVSDDRGKLGPGLEFHALLAGPRYSCEPARAPGPPHHDLQVNAPLAVSHPCEHCLLDLTLVFDPPHRRIQHLNQASMLCVSRQLDSQIRLAQSAESRRYARGGLRLKFESPHCAVEDRLHGRFARKPSTGNTVLFKSFVMIKAAFPVEHSNRPRLYRRAGKPGRPVRGAQIVIPGHIRPACRSSHAHPR